jgi:hypothetical protein
MTRSREGVMNKNILYAIVAFLIGGFFIYSGAQERLALSKLKKVGERVEVETPDGYTEHKKSGSSTYTAEFKFSTAKGVAVQRKKSFPEALIADFENGTPVYVLYDPANPYEFVFEKEEPEWFLILFGIAFVGGALWYARKTPEATVEA